MDDVNKIVQAIKAKKLSPVYLLMGEEPYYIDQISAYIEQNVLTEDEKAFNQTILYGRDVSVDDIVGAAKRYPMMAEYQVIIVKEAQDLARTIDNLQPYIKNPQPTTILVLCYKHKKLDKRKTIYKAIKKAGVVFESKPLYENQVPNWIANVLKGRGYSIVPKASQLLVEFLGTDLGKINNELEKLQLILPEGAQITPELIEQNIGISKDFNNFELQKALGRRDFEKAFRIITYFSQNPKDNPIFKTVPILYLYFSKLLQYHGLNNKSPKSVASALRINPYFIDDYSIGAKNYPMRKVSQIIEILRETDLKGKGVDAVSATQADLLKDLLIKISN